MSRPRRKQQTEYIIWHCSATPPSNDGLGAADIDRMHKERGWKGIGYHFVIKRNGKIEIGEHPYNIGAHTLGVNAISVGVCLVGGVDEGGDPESNFTREQQDSAFALADVLEKMFPGAEHRGHRDFSPDLDNDGEVKPWEWMKSCPVFDAEKTFELLEWTLDEADKVEDGNGNMGSPSGSWSSPSFFKASSRDEED